MCHKKAFEALDRTLQDLRGNSAVMGGLTVVLSGDFRQTLPIIPRGTRADEVGASIKASYLWRNVHSLTLSTNIRVQIGGDNPAFAFPNQLLQLGNGSLPSKPGTNLVTLPFGICVDLISSLRCSSKLVIVVLSLD